MLTLRHRELKKDLRDVIRPVYLVHGDEPLLVEESWRMIEVAALGEAMAQFNEDVFRAREINAGEVAATCHVLPVMADRRVVLVREVNFWKAVELEPLLAYIEKPSPSTCLILAASEKLDARGKFVKACGKSGAVIEARRPYGRELAAEVNKLIKDQGKLLEHDAAGLLLDLAGTDLQSLKMQIEKLSLYVGDRKNITRDDVSEAVADIKLFTIFEFTDALGGKNIEATLRSFRRMLELGEEPVKILGMVARHFRILFQLKENQKNRVPIEESARFFKLPPGIVKNKYLPQTKRFALKELVNIWKMLADLDYQLKSRGSPKETRELIFEQMITKLCRT